MNETSVALAGVITTAVINIGVLCWNIRQVSVQHQKTSELAELTSELQNKVNRLSRELDQSLRRLYRARELLAGLFELKANYPIDPGNSIRMIGYWAELSAIAVYLQNRFGSLGEDFKAKKDALGPTMIRREAFAMYDAKTGQNTPEFDEVIGLFELVEKMIDQELHSSGPSSLA